MCTRKTHRAAASPLLEFPAGCWEAAPGPDGCTARTGPPSWSARCPYAPSWFRYRDPVIIPSRRTNACVPQRRRRLITIYTRDPDGRKLLAEKGTLLPSPTHQQPITLRQAIGGFEPLDARTNLRSVSDPPTASRGSVSNTRPSETPRKDDAPTTTNAQTAAAGTTPFSRESRERIFRRAALPAANGCPVR